MMAGGEGREGGSRNEPEAEPQIDREEEETIGWDKDGGRIEERSADLVIL